MKHLLVPVFLLMALTSSYAQTADEIIDKYIEATGGKDNWAKIENMKATGKAMQQGMEFPFVGIQMKDGRQFNSFTFQGKEIKQGVYDGTSLWSTNFMNMKAEKSAAEATENFKANLGADFPTSFFNYKQLGHKVELLGKETVEGTETFKIKLTKKPIKVDGQPKDNIEIYFFDTENYVPLMVETEVNDGPAKGSVAQIKFSDYQEVNGVFIAFTTSQSVKGGPVLFSATTTSVEFNTKIDVSIFKMPVE